MNPGDRKPLTALPKVELRPRREHDMQMLQALQDVALKHPVALQSAFNALIAEGREFARSREGQRWREKLARSRLLQRVRLAWETSTLLVLQEEPPDTLPSAYVDALFMVASSTELEPLLDEFFRRTLAPEPER